MKNLIKLIWKNELLLSEISNINLPVWSPPDLDLAPWPPFAVWACLSLSAWDALL